MSSSAAATPTVAAGTAASAAAGSGNPPSAAASAASAAAPASAEAVPAQKKSRSRSPVPAAMAAATSGAGDAAAAAPPPSESPGQSLLAAARAGDDELVEKLLDQRGDASYQDPATGQSALMLAAGSGHTAVVSELLINGAPYNAVDRDGRCAGNYAMDAGEHRIVDALVDAGVTAELLFTRMAARRAARAAKAAAVAKEVGASTTSAVAVGATPGNRGGTATTTTNPGSAAAAAPAAARVNDSTGAAVDYFKQGVRYTADGKQLLDSTQDAVMMEWERPLMQAHAAVMIPDGTEPRTRDVLNIGFGLGIIDGLLQERSPRTHTIIEAHPDVYAACVEKGWDKKQGVRVLKGLWQEVLDRELSVDGHQKYDAIFFDTYSEDWREQRKLHELLPRLLKSNGGVYSFFNGFCPDNVFFQEVACQVVKLELKGMGISTNYVPVPIDCSSDETWQGVRQRYFHEKTYRMPVCRFGRVAANAEAAPVAAAE